jgi:hypothetical protein
MRRKREKPGLDSEPDNLSRIAQSPDETAQAQLLLATEDQWLTDRLNGIADSTKQLLHENYYGSTPTGKPLRKRDFVELVESGRQRGTESRSLDRTMKLYGMTAISTGTVAVSTATRTHSYRYLRVFVNENGQWLIIASFATETGDNNL